MLTPRGDPPEELVVRDQAGTRARVARQGFPVASRAVALGSSREGKISAAIAERARSRPAFGGEPCGAVRAGFDAPGGASAVRGPCALGKRVYAPGGRISPRNGFNLTVSAVPRSRLVVARDAQHA